MATSLQFNIRSLLAAMVITAVVLAAGLPVVRSWGTASQLHFLVNAVVLTGMIASLIVVRCVVRRRVERQAGEVLLCATTQGNHFIRILHWLLLLLFLAGLLYLAAGQALSDEASSSPLYAKAAWLNLIYLAWAAAWIVTNCWWRTGPGIAELTEKGLIVMGTRFVPYEQCKNIRWNRYFPNTLMLSTPYHQLVQVAVPSRHRDDLESFLAKNGWDLQ